MRFSSFLLVCALLVAGCGGGGSSSNRAPVQTTSGPAVGNITLLLGDNPLAGIDQVLIDIRQVRLLGEDGQVTITDGPLGVIDLLSLQNLTELIASKEVPAGEYSKIRLLIDGLQIVETGNPSPVDVQLPANGKIDLNPQGSFEISPGEDLVVQIDFDLARSIKVVTTGNSQYRFRPVVFIDVLDQAENLRLTRLFGNLQEDDDVEGDDEPGRPSDYDLCTEFNSDPCVDVVLGDGVVILNADGDAIDPVDLLLPEDVHIFGHYFIGVTGGEFFRAKLIAVAGEDGLERIEGDVNSVVRDDDTFELIDDEVTTNVLVTDALLLDDMGAALSYDIAPGQEAEAWALDSVLALADEGVFPAILVQVENEEDDIDDEESFEGNLVDLDGDTLTIADDGDEFCVVLTDDTVILLISDYDGDAETDRISRTALGDLISAGVEVEAFGDVVGDCIEATVIAAEID